MSNSPKKTRKPRTKPVELTADEQAELRQMKKLSAASRFLTTWSQVSAALTMPGWLIIHDLQRPAEEGLSESFLVGERLVGGIEQDYEDMLREFLRLKIVEKRDDLYFLAKTFEGVSIKAVYEAVAANKDFKKALDLLSRYRHGVEDVEEQGEK